MTENKARGNYEPSIAWCVDTVVSMSSNGCPDQHAAIPFDYYEWCSVSKCKPEEEVFLLRCACWTTKKQSHGRICVSQLSFLGIANADQLAKRLVELGLMEKDEDSYLLV